MAPKWPLIIGIVGIPNPVSLLWQSRILMLYSISSCLVRHLTCSSSDRKQITDTLIITFSVSASVILSVFCWEFQVKLKISKLKKKKDSSHSIVIFISPALRADPHMLVCVHVYVSYFCSVIPKPCFLKISDEGCHSDWIYK